MVLNEESRKFFECLSEKEKRLFAGLEAKRLGWHGVKRVSEFYHIHPHTVRRGKQELENEQEPQREGIRRPGGGRKKSEQTYPSLDAIFLEILREHTAGEPMQSDVRWTYLDDTAIRDQLHERGCPVSVSVVKRLLKKHKFGRRRMVKQKTFKQNLDRNAQFEQIATVNTVEAKSSNPILSMDTKKKSISGHSIEQDESM